MSIKIEIRRTQLERGEMHNSVKGIVGNKGPGELRHEGEEWFTGQTEVELGTF